MATNSFFDDPGDVVFVEEPNDITYNVTDAILKNYLADEDVLAGYIMQTLEKGSLKIIAGLRFEETRNSFTNTEILTRPEGLPVSFVSPGFLEPPAARAFSQQTTSEKTYHHILPAVIVRKELGEKTVVRASYTETIARPKFTDLVPREIIRSMAPSSEIASTCPTSISRRWNRQTSIFPMSAISRASVWFRCPAFTRC